MFFEDEEDKTVDGGVATDAPADDTMTNGMTEEKEGGEGETAA